MNTRVSTPLLSLSVLLLAGSFLVGCSDVKQRSYSVSVRNDSATPITVWLTKDGPLYERQWRSPEDMAIESRRAGEMIAGPVIKPGQTASVTQVGQFSPHTNAVLRFYYGEHNLSDLLAISHDNPARRDFELGEGMNAFAVRSDDRGGLLVEREDGAAHAGEPAAAPAAAPR